MYKEARLIRLYCENPVHAGSGDELGVIDLPVQREKHTDFPVIQASTLKGALRESFESEMAVDNALEKSLFKDLQLTDESLLKTAINMIFGEEGKKFASAISFTDARILLFPVRSVRNTFVWITSPFVINRLRRDLELCKSSVSLDLPLLEEGVAISTNSNLMMNSNRVILEEFTFDAIQDERVDILARWIGENIFPGISTYSYWKRKLLSDLVVLNEDDFRDFVKMSTEVIARTKINSETRVVSDGGLWYEENIPSDTLFYSLVMASDVLKPENKLQQLKSSRHVLDFFTSGLNERIQLGGNQTIGKGIMRVDVMTGGLNHGS